MEEVSLKITIAGKTYPVTVKSSEEPLVTKAAEMIAKQVNELSSTYAVRDKQDLLAMCALQMALGFQRSDEERKEIENKVLMDLKSLNTEISEHLK